MSQIELTLLTKQDCHLCVEAKAVVARVLSAAENSDIPVVYKEVDIDDNADFADKYADDIPVVLLNGKPHASFYVYEDKLAYAILHERDRLLRHKTSWWRRKFGSKTN
ncbi:MAG: glutaredoxin family protein [Microbacteriaceae bacterium]|nr:glutaredoxin family protein [Microbacteriaceae bacterium]